MKLFGWIIPWWVQPAIMAALFAGLMLTRATLHDERQDRALEHAQQKTATAQIEAAAAKRVADAANIYAGKVSAMQPIILRSIDKVQTYAQTPAGRAECLDALRVSSILDDRAALAVAASGSGGAVPARDDPAAHADQR